MGLFYLNKRRALSAVLAFMVSIVFSINLTQAQDSEWDYWKNHNPDDQRTINHTPMTNIVNGTLVEDKRKKKLVFEAFGKKGLLYTNTYIKFLEDIPISTFNKDEQLAYWLNLHNAQVIALLVETRKIRKRVKKERGTPLAPGTLWAEKRLTVEGMSLSLNDIEQNILLRNWKDPLILYGLNYGVEGSHLIEGGALHGPTVNDQLAMAAVEFIQKTRNVRVKRGNLDISSLYGWNYDLLFSSNDENIIEHLKLYANDELTAELANISKINKNKFNWKTISYEPRGSGRDAGLALLTRGS